MANDITANPIYIDSTTSAAITGTVAIHSVQFTGAAAGDQVIIKNNPEAGTVETSKILVSLKVAANTSSIVFVPSTPIMANGMKVTTLSSNGVVIIQI